MSERPAPRKLVTAWTKLLIDLETAARHMGATDPQVYIEGNSGLVVMDGPPHDEHCRARLEAVLFVIPWPPGRQGGVGAW